jgi:hypothetical protein
VTQVPRPDRTVRTDLVLAQVVCTAAMDAPGERIDLPAWLRTLPDREFQRCAPPDHKAAGYTVTDDGRPMTVMVELIGADLFVQHYEYQTVSRNHCRLVSDSDVLTPVGWTTCRVIWELTADPVDDQTSRLTNALTSHPTAELMQFIAWRRQRSDAAATAAQAAFADHLERETPRYAQSIARHANAHS